MVGPHRGDHLSYVVVRLWDERRLLYCRALLHHRAVRELDPQRHRDHGHSRIRRRFLVPFDEMRAELDRLLADSELWDGEQGAAGDRCRRWSGPGADRGQRTECRRAVRPAVLGAEGMVNWVQHNRVLPTQRIEAAETITEVEPRSAGGDGETKRVASSLFSGSPEADARARAFDDNAPDRENDFAEPGRR